MKYLILMLVIIIGAGCSFTSTNSESDMRDAKKITDDFFFLNVQHRLSEARPLFSREFLEVTSFEQFQTICIKLDSFYGPVVSYSIKSWQTNVTKGANPSSEYYLVYGVRRSKAATVESVGLIKEGDSIKIASYNVNHDLSQ